MKIKDPLDSTQTQKKTPATTSSVSSANKADARTRASKSLVPMTKGQQRIAINNVIKSLMLNQISQGMALRELRVNVLGLKQEVYTELTGVSRKTLSEIENDKGNYTLDILNRVFKPFDLKVGVVPTSSTALKSALRKTK